MGQEAVDTCHSYVIEALRMVAQDFGSQGGLLRYGDVAGASGGDYDRAGSRAVFPAVYNADMGNFIIGEREILS